MPLVFVDPNNPSVPMTVQACLGVHACGWTWAPGCLGYHCMSFAGPGPYDEMNGDLDHAADCGTEVASTDGAGWETGFGPGEIVHLNRYDREFVDDAGRPVTVWCVHAEIDVWRHASVFASLEEATVEYEAHVRWLEAGQPRDIDRR